MRKKIAFFWETIHQNTNSETTRAQVIGGWLIHIAASQGKHHSSSCTFVSDHDHLWTIVNANPPVDAPKETSVSEGF